MSDDTPMPNPGGDMGGPTNSIQPNISRNSSLVARAPRGMPRGVPLSTPKQSAAPPKTENCGKVKSLAANFNSEENVQQKSPMRPMSVTQKPFEGGNDDTSGDKDEKESDVLHEEHDDDLGSWANFYGDDNDDDDGNGGYLARPSAVNMNPMVQAVKSKSITAFNSWEGNEEIKDDDDDRKLTRSVRFHIDELTAGDDETENDENDISQSTTSMRRSGATPRDLGDSVRSSRRVSLFDTKQLKKMNSTIKELHFLRFCYHLICWHMFWILYSILILVEMFLAAWNPFVYPSIKLTQEIILCISFIMHTLQLCGHLYHHKIQVQAKKNDGQTKISYWLAMRTYKWNTPLVLETVCLVAGMVFIWEYPGIALLRLFRTFRLLFYHDGKEGLPEAVLRPMTETLACITGEEYVLLMMKVLKFASRSLQNMGREMFYLTSKSKGGFIMVFMMLFSAYVIGATFWIALSNSGESNNQFCHNIYSCVFTMIRLSFFDGDGFDFAYGVLYTHPRLFIILAIYFFLTAIGMANGLIGVFGGIFKTNSRMAFQTSKQKEEEEAALLEKNDMKDFQETMTSNVTHLEKRMVNIESMLAQVIDKLENQAKTRSA